MQKEVKIIGLSIKEKFGILQAVDLKFDENMKLTMIKGEVGAGKTTLNKALRLTTQGTYVLQDKNLYTENIHIETQLSDNGQNVWVGCKSAKDGSLKYYIYMLDENGKKINDVVLDGIKATPSSYLKNMQTALTWRLDEFTSENPITQRKILLDLYKKELEERGVIFDKNHPDYVGNIIDEIEKAKDNRNYKDMKRKEVGGIADDMSKKGINFDDRVEIVDTTKVKEELDELKSKRTLMTINLKQTKESLLQKIKLEGVELVGKLKDANIEIQKRNQKNQTTLSNHKISKEAREQKLKDLVLSLSELVEVGKVNDIVLEINKNLIKHPEPDVKIEKELEFDLEKGSCMSKVDDFENQDVKSLLEKYIKIKKDYIEANDKPIEEVDTTDIDRQIEEKDDELSKLVARNKNGIAINSFHDWKESDKAVKDLNKDYYKKLTGINTGVEGLHICPEYTIEDGEKVAKGNDIYLMYDGSYDPKYFNNQDKELRKLSSYSDTQKPMICLLIQKYLLSRKSKTLPYLWIDQVPIDKKTKALLDKMSEELGLYLFVNWTGDFEVESLKDGEILVQNGEIFNPILNKEI